MSSFVGAKTTQNFLRKNESPDFKCENKNMAETSNPKPMERLDEETYCKKREEKQASKDEFNEEKYYIEMRNREKQIRR